MEITIGCAFRSDQVRVALKGGTNSRSCRGIGSNQQRRWQEINAVRSEGCCLTWAGLWTFRRS